MGKVLVSGLVNIETTCKVNSFPVQYTSVDFNFFGVNIYPAGVGLNISLALKQLGDDVKLLSIIGDDVSSKMVIDVLNENNISTDYLLTNGDTATSVILYDNNGRRRVYCDLKDIQEKAYDEELFFKAVQDCDAVCLCNVNFSRSLISLAKDYNKLIATDVHCLSDVNDEYNNDFINNADILFLSNENIVGKEEEFLRLLSLKQNLKVIVIGMGDKGSVMYDRLTDSIYYQEACTDYKVVNTVGAGDALFSSFVHFYVKGYKVRDCLELATKFAAKKISVDGAAKGFVSEDMLLRGDSFGGKTQY